MEFVELIFGAWLREFVLPALNQRLQERVTESHSKPQKHYTPVSYDTLMAFMLHRFIQGLQKHKKHALSSKTLESADVGLIGIHRAEAINSKLDFQTNQMRSICHGVTSVLLRFVALGSLCAADESIFPSYSKRADEKGLLQHVPGKPYDYGMLIYLLGQCLTWTKLRVCVAVEPKFLPPRPTETEAVLRMLSRLKENTGRDDLKLHIVMDSLWSKAASVEKFINRGHVFTVAVASNSGVLAADHLVEASADLPLHKTRTLAQDQRVLQLFSGENRVTPVLSNAWIRAAPQVAGHSHSYREAVGFLSRHDDSSFAREFDLKPPDSNLPLPHMIKVVTGWDVLRPKDQQDPSILLERNVAQQMNKQQLWWIHWTKVRDITKTARDKMSKEEFLEELFPHHEPRQPPLTQQARKRAVVDNNTLHTEIIGDISDNTAVYNVFNSTWNLIDQMDEDYHNHFQLHGTKHTESWAVQSIAHFVFSSTRSLWEEHRASLKYNINSGNYHAGVEHKPLTLPEFIVRVATEFKQVLLQRAAKDNN